MQEMQNTSLVVDLRSLKVSLFVVDLKVESGRSESLKVYSCREQLTIDRSEEEADHDRNHQRVEKNLVVGVLLRPEHQDDLPWRAAGHTHLEKKFNLTI